jgi:hypothetical protein
MPKQAGKRISNLELGMRPYTKLAFIMELE